MSFLLSHNCDEKSLGVPTLDFPLLDTRDSDVLSRYIE
jgi:hypothetical protein